MSTNFYLYLQEKYSKSGYKYWIDVLARLENIIVNFQDTTKSKFPVFAAISSLLYVPHINIKDFEPNDYEQLLPIIYTNNADALIRKMKEYYITQKFILNTFESFANGQGFIFRNSGIKQCIIITVKYKNFDSFKINSKFSNKQIEIINSIYYIPIIYKMLIESRFKNYLTMKYMLTIENQIWENMSMTRTPYYFNKTIDPKILDVIKKYDMILSGSISEFYSMHTSRNTNNEINSTKNISKNIKYPVFVFHDAPEKIAENLLKDLKLLNLENKPRHVKTSYEQEDNISMFLSLEDSISYTSNEVDVFSETNYTKPDDKQREPRELREISISKLNSPYFPYYISMTNIYVNKELLFIICDYPRKSLIRYNIDSNGFKYTDPTSTMLSLFMIAWMFKKADINIYKQIYQTIYNIRKNLDNLEIGKEFYGYKVESVFMA